MSLASPFMDDLDRARERPRAAAEPKARWSARRTLLFVVVASMVLWGLIAAVVLHLH